MTDELAAAIRAVGEQWEDLLATAGDDAVRQRPVEGGWSALEHGCHVRNALSVAGDRIVLARAGGGLDAEAAALDEHANEQDRVAVAGDLGANARRLAELLAGGDEDGVGRSALEVATQHREDAEALLSD